MSGGKLLRILLPPVCTAAAAFCAIHLCAAPVSTPAAKTDAAALQAMEAMFEKALTAYNAGDAAGFFADFAKGAAPPANEQTFRALFEGVYKAELGECVSKKLNTNESVADPTHGVLVYEAMYSNWPKVRLSANFIREGKALKLVQVRMEKM